MTDIVETRLNRTPYSASSCSWLIGGVPYVGITKLDYSEKRERKLVHASRKDGTPLGITGGKYSVDALSMTMLRSSFQRLVDQLSLLGVGSYGDAEVPIVATYSERKATLALVPPIVIVIDGAVITGVKDGYSEGVEALVTDVEWMALSLTRNGRRLWSVASGV